MTDQGQETGVEILGCQVKLRPADQEREVAQAVVELVQTEVAALKKVRPALGDTDVAVLVALKMATDKVKLEQEFRTTLLRAESSLERAVARIQDQA